jgi:hypothetical protein
MQAVGGARVKRFKMRYGRRNWIYLAQDMRQWLAASNTRGFLNRLDLFTRWVAVGCSCACSELSLIKRNLNYGVRVRVWLRKLPACRLRCDGK